MFYFSIFKKEDNQVGTNKKIQELNNVHLEIYIILD